MTSWMDWDIQGMMEVRLEQFRKPLVVWHSSCAGPRKWEAQSDLLTQTCAQESLAVCTFTFGESRTADIKREQDLAVPAVITVREVGCSLE